MPGIRVGVPLSVVLVVFLVVACERRDRTFRHDGHVTVTKGVCVPCHGPDPANPRPASTADCAACHRQAADPAKAGRYGLSGAPERSLPDTYRDIVFSHGTHADAGVACDACHRSKGAPGFPSMSGCTLCHETEGAPTSCRSCHRNSPTDAPRSAQPGR